MHNKLLFILFIIELVIYVIVQKPNKDSFSYKHTLNTFKINDIKESKLENYIIGVVAAEMPASFSFEALKSQAVAARTFAYKKILSINLNIDTLNQDKGQGYISIDEMKIKWGENFEENYKLIKDAVLSTKGEIVTYNNEPINAYYFSMSNGITEDSKKVFKEESYLTSVDSKWDKDVKNYELVKKIDINTFKKILDLKCNEINVDNLSISSTNHVDEITVCSKKYSGIEFRKILDLRSTDFSIDVKDSEVLITTRGYGHGVGLSQYGANYLGTQGKNYIEILKYYYKDVEIKKYSIF